MLSSHNTRIHERSVDAGCGQIWIDGDFWFSMFAAAGLAAALFLNQAITMAGRKRRRKRHNLSHLVPLTNHPLGKFNNLFFCSLIVSIPYCL